MKSVVVLLVIFFSIIVIGQPQLENNMDNDFRVVSDVVKQIVGWLMVFLIVVFGIGATVMNLSRKDTKNKKIES